MKCTLVVVNHPMLRNTTNTKVLNYTAGKEWSLENETYWPLYKYVSHGNNSNHIMSYSGSKVFTYTLHCMHANSECQGAENRCTLSVKTSLVVWWSEFLTTNHEVPGSIPGPTMAIFPGRGRIPVVTMVWVVSRIRLKVETSVTRSHNSINSDWIHDRDLLAGEDLTTRDSQHISS